MTLGVNSDTYPANPAQAPLRAAPSSPPPEPAPESQDVLSLATAMAAGLKELRRAQAQTLGLRPAALALLLALAQGPLEGLLVSEAASALGVRPQALSGLAAELAEGGWLAREVDPADGRARRLALTPLGRARLAPAQELQRALAAELRALMPNPALARLAFGRFLQALENVLGGKSQ